MCKCKLPQWKQAGMPVWRADLAARRSLALPRRSARLLQFKCAAVEGHHLGDAVDFELANIGAVAYEHHNTFVVMPRTHPDLFRIIALCDCDQRQAISRLQINIVVIKTRTDIDSWPFVILQRI